MEVILKDKWSTRKYRRQLGAVSKRFRKSSSGENSAIEHNAGTSVSMMRTNRRTITRASAKAKEPV